MSCEKDENKQKEAEVGPFKKLIYRILEVDPLPVRFNFFRVVKPFHLHHHVAVPGLPEQLDLTYVGPVYPGSRKKDRAVTDVDDFSATLDRPMEKFLGLALTAGSTVAFVMPVPQRPSSHGIDPVNVRLLRLSDLKYKMKFNQKHWCL